MCVSSPYVVDVSERRRVRDDRRVVASDLARKDEAANVHGPADLEVDAGRAEDVARAVEGRHRVLAEREPLLPVDAGHAGGGVGAVIRRVEGQRGTIPRRARLVPIPRLLLVEMAGVQQQDSQEVLGSVSRYDVAAVALPRERRQVAAVVDVGVGQQDLANRARLDRQRLPVPHAQLFEALEQPAVYERRPAVDVHGELRAGHRAGGAEELNGDCGLTHFTAVAGDGGFPSQVRVNPKENQPLTSREAGPIGAFGDVQPDGPYCPRPIVVS
jgi:hypothetical protein